MFKQSKKTLTLLVAITAIGMLWAGQSLSASPQGKGKKKNNDTTAPAVVNVSVLSNTYSSIDIGWTATADDGNDPSSGAATEYDVRYSSSDPDGPPYSGDLEAWFADAWQAHCTPVPGAHGTAEFATAGDLSEVTRYWLAVKVADEAENWSSVSNVVSELTDLTPSGEWMLEMVDPLHGPTSDFDGPALTYDSGGNPSIAYSNSENDPDTGEPIHPVQFAYWGGNTWNIELVESYRGHYVDLAYDPVSDEATISYSYESGAGASDSLNFARRIGPDDWQITIIESGNKNFYGRNSLAFDPNGNPSVSFSRGIRRGHRGSETDLLFAYWDANGSSRETELVGPGVYGCLAYDPASGLPTIAYFSNTDDGVDGNETLQFARRTAPPPLAGSWEIDPVATVRPGRASLVYDADGSPSIAFTECVSSGDDILKFARWNGSSWVIENVDSPLTSRFGSSLAYDAGGTPYISYADDDAGVVKLAHQIGPNQWTIEIVTSCVLSRASSLGFDSSGNPSIAYSNISIDRPPPLYKNEYLRLARIAQ